MCAGLFFAGGRKGRGRGNRRFLALLGMTQLQELALVVGAYAATGILGVPRAVAADAVIRRFSST